MSMGINITQKIADDVKLGKGVEIYDFVNLYGCEIGDNTKIGAYIEIQERRGRYERATKVSKRRKLYNL